jgi:hypothetical protein
MHARRLDHRRRAHRLLSRTGARRIPFQRLRLRVSRWERVAVGGLPARAGDSARFHGGRHAGTVRTRMAWFHGRHRSGADPCRRSVGTLPLRGNLEGQGTGWTEDTSWRRRRASGTNRQSRPRPARRTGRPVRPSGEQVIGTASPVRLGWAGGVPFWNTVVRSRTNPRNARFIGASDGTRGRTRRTDVIQTNIQST